MTVRASSPAAGRARRRDADGRERCEPHGSDRHVHQRWCEHGRERAVHDHVHLADGGDGDRACLDARCRSAGSAPFTVETDGVAPNSARRGEDVRGREHPDHAADGDEPGRHEPHAARATSTSTTAARLRERAGGDGLHGERSSAGPGTSVRPRTARTVGATGTCDVTITSATTGTSIDPGDDDGHGRRCLADARRPVTRMPVTARTRRRRG